MDKRCFALAGDVDFSGMEQAVYDVVVVGSGIAGMSVALSLDEKLRILVVDKTEASESSTFQAQGGIAVAVAPDDSPERHMADTLRVGQELCNQASVRVLAEEGPAALDFLQAEGVVFNVDGNDLDLTREAGHSCRRVVHYYDYTGRQISQSLRKRLEHQQNIDHQTESFLVDILTIGDNCAGCVLYSRGRHILALSRAVVIASGGYAGLFARSSNSSAASGDGIAAAYRAGAAIADMEFVQFHPTTFTTPEGEVFLLTEALRGEGAYLRNTAGERFMLAYHTDGELAPRDEVSRAIRREMKITGNQVYLDARHLGGENIKKRFQHVYTKLASNNYYMEKDLIPVAPSAHYSIGGIMTDSWGRTSIGNLYACGEAAATGVHGANRLASNSLLEGVVFGRRVARKINSGGLAQTLCTPAAPVRDEPCPAGGSVKVLGGMLDEVAGVVRGGPELDLMLQYLKRLAEKGTGLEDIQERYKIINAYQLTKLIIEAALIRRESRGTHYRADCPRRNDSEFGKHIVQQWGKGVMLK